MQQKNGRDKNEWKLELDGCGCDRLQQSPNININVKNVDENGQILSLTRAAAGF